MDNLSTKAILLDMTTDLSRVGNFALQGKEKRVKQFADKLNQAIIVLQNRVVPERITFFIKKIANIVSIINQNKAYDPRMLAEDAFTCGNILSKRARNFE